MFYYFIYKILCVFVLRVCVIGSEVFMFSNFNYLQLVSGENSVQNFSPEQLDLLRRSLESFIFNRLCLINDDSFVCYPSEKNISELSDLIDLHVLIFGGFSEDNPLYPSVVRFVKKCGEVCE